MPTGRYTHLTARVPAARDGRGPFDGFNQFGISRKLGYEAVNQFQAEHSISGPASWLV